MVYLVVSRQMLYCQKDIKIEQIKEEKQLDLRIQMKKLK